MSASNRTAIINSQGQQSSMWGEHGKQSHLFRFNFLYLTHWATKNMGMDCQNSLEHYRCSAWVQTQFKDAGFIEWFQGVQSKASGRANIPDPNFPQPKTLAWGNNSTKSWEPRELYWFGRSLKVTLPHICLPCRHTDRETERPPGGPAIEHHRRNSFGGIFLISCTAALTFVSLPFPLLLFSCFNTLHTHACTLMETLPPPNPSSSAFHLQGSHSNDAASWASRMGLRHGNNDHFQLFVSK